MHGKRRVNRSQEFILLKIILVIGSVAFIALHWFLAYRRIINQ